LNHQPATQLPSSAGRKDGLAMSRALRTLVFGLQAREVGVVAADFMDARLIPDPQTAAR